MGHRSHQPSLRCYILSALYDAVNHIILNDAVCSIALFDVVIYTLALFSVVVHSIALFDVFL